MAINSVPSLSLCQPNAPIVEIRGCTEAKVFKFSYTWTIRNFSFCHEDMCEQLQSPTFKFGDNDEIEGYLELYIKNNSRDADDFFSIYLTLVSSKKSVGPAIRACMEICILNDTGKKSCIRGGLTTVGTYTQSFPGNSHGFARFIGKEILLAKQYKLLPDDTLTILCSGSAAAEIVNTVECNRIPLKVPDCEVRNQLGEFLENEKLSDVTLVVNDQEYKAHKVILAARSSIFAAMFDDETEEKPQNRFDITDIEDKVFREMLRFIYTGAAQNFENMADGLLAAADRYSLSVLKTMCEEALASSIAVDNAANILLLADLHSADKLKSQAIEFIVKNALAVKDTASFELMIRSQPYLLYEALSALALTPNSRSSSSKTVSKQEQES